VLAGKTPSASMRCSMPFQIRLGIKPRPTVWAAEWLNVTVNQLMSPQVATTVEFLLTNRAFKWQIVGVSSFVVFPEVYFGSKTATTFITLK